MLQGTRLQKKTKNKKIQSLKIPFLLSEEIRTPRPQGVGGGRSELVDGGEWTRSRKTLSVRGVSSGRVRWSWWGSPNTVEVRHPPSRGCDPGQVKSGFLEWFQFRNLESQKPLKTRSVGPVVSPKTPQPKYYVNPVLQTKIGNPETLSGRTGSGDRGSEYRPTGTSSPPDRAGRTKGCPSPRTKTTDVTRSTTSEEGRKSRRIQGAQSLGVRVDSGAPVTPSCGLGTLLPDVFCE